MELPRYARLGDLLTEWRHRGVRADQPPRTVQAAAAAAGISRNYLYKLLNGTSSPRDYMVARISNGWGFSLAVVKDAVARTVRDGVLVR